MNHQLIRLEFTLVRHQIARHNSLRAFLVGSACGDNGAIYLS